MKKGFIKENKEKTLKAPYRLIACDLDGTLLDNSSRVGEGNLAAIAELSKRGVHFVPSTGRAYREIPKELLRGDSIRYVIYANGAAVLDRATGERMLFTVEGDLLCRVRDILSRYDVHIAVRYMGATYLSREQNNLWAYRKYDICPEHEHVVVNYAEELRDFTEWFSCIEQAEVVTVFTRTLDDAVRLRSEVSFLRGIRTVSVAYNNIEILSDRAGKGNALIALADKLGIPHSGTVAVGDSGNDIPSLSAAGLALAVSNGTDEIRTAADEVICSNEEGVVPYLLKKYF